MGVIGNWVLPRMTITPKKVGLKYHFLVFRREQKRSWPIGTYNNRPRKVEKVKTSLG